MSPLATAQVAAALSLDAHPWLKVDLNVTLRGR
jgi:hypothetical protein